MNGGDHPSAARVTTNLRAHARAAYPLASGEQPSNVNATFRSSWPCSRWSLPSHPTHAGCWWSLTPPFHPYLGSPRRSIFCGTCPWVAPGGCYPPPCSVESGLSSDFSAAARPTHPHPVYLVPNPGWVCRSARARVMVLRSTGPTVRTHHWCMWGQIPGFSLARPQGRRTVQRHTGLGCRLSRSQT